MDSTELKRMQASIKANYLRDPETACITLKAEGKIGEGISCKVNTGRALVEAGLHPATGGNGLLACSGDMLLEALVACAGVTLSAVATAIGVEIQDGNIRAEGDLDFRGTLGVGFKAIRLFFAFTSNAADEQIGSLAKLTERYCVVYQTLIKGVHVQTFYDR
mgnify:CR=1 FL=1